MPAEISTEDRLAAQRMGGLLDYVEALVKLDEQVALRLAQHRLQDGSQFILHQHELAGLPGIQLDVSDADGPVWLRIERLKRTKPPEVDETIRDWVDLSNDPTRLPALRETRHVRMPQAEKNRLIESGEARPEDCAPSLKADDESKASSAHYFDVMLRLEDRPAIREAAELYCSGPWAEWAESEKPRRRSISVYQRLFEIAQRLLQSGGNESVELVWGIGLAKWNREQFLIDIPMIERGVEIELADQANAEITIRPRSASATVELRAFQKIAAERLALAEDAARRCLKSLEAEGTDGISPFRAESFEPILKICGSQLDSEGRYLPDHQPIAPTEPVPEPQGDHLTVSDRFVIFARRRSANSVLRDIERLKAEIAPKDKDPVVLLGAARTLVMGPKDGIDDGYQPLGDKIGTLDQFAEYHEEPVDPDHGDLFFPKAFNDDQVQIIRRLEKSDGMVVQGPPGTGKTHTIANIISHMLATGRRVLVVSHGETALKVIREQLPEGVSDLAISVTTSEREGLKQIEKAIGLMLGIVNTIDTNRNRQIKVIRDIESGIVTSRKRLAEIDAKLAEIASKHLSAVPGTKETPYDVAKKVIDGRSQCDWFTDQPDRPFEETGIGDTAVSAVAAARRRIGADLQYIGQSMPSPANLPDAATVRAWHEDLVLARSLGDEGRSMEPQTRRVIAKLGVEGADDVADKLTKLADRMAALSAEPWARELTERCLAASPAMKRLQPMAFEFLDEAEDLVTGRTPFVARPVYLPAELPPPQEFFEILETLAKGKNPFGMFAFRLKAHQAAIEEILVTGTVPGEPDDWLHVHAFTLFRHKVANLSARWEALRAELRLPEELYFGPDELAALDVLTDTLRTAIVEMPREYSELGETLRHALGNHDEVRAILRHENAVAAFARDLSNHTASIRLNAVVKDIENVAKQFSAGNNPISAGARKMLADVIGQPETDSHQLGRVWGGVCAKLGQLKSLGPHFERISEVCAQLEKAGAPKWAERLKTEPSSADADPVIPPNWKDSWNWASSLRYLEKIGAAKDLAKLHSERLAVEDRLKNGFAALVKERTFFNLAVTMKGSAKTALRSFADIIRRLGRGTGQRATLYRQDARRAMESCYDVVPCWIMPTWRVSEQLPSNLGSFDLVIIDEASQSDARELPALLRGKKVLVVGDDRQVSPSAAFLSIANIRRLRENFLREFPFRAQVEPGASIYDLARVMFPDKFVMLKEHFRCVEPIIRFSMQFYNDPLVPLRIPKEGERLDPPLVDIFVEDGERRGKSKVNPREAEVIVDEIAALVGDPALSEVPATGRPRSIGVISLIGAEQALYIQKLLMERIGEAAMVRHRVVCGDSATLQGDERDIVFVSMIADRHRKQSQTATQYEQRFNVALSRARDRMVLVRSVSEEQLNPKDLKARVITHFRDPMPSRSDPNEELIEKCQSGFEREVFAALSSRGYRVVPQVGSLGFSIDMVVEGEGGRRLAIECDGDLYHGPERWAEDMRRQRILERVGWTFWRCFGSNYRIDPDGTLEDLVQILQRMQIAPVAGEKASYRFTEHRTIAPKTGDADKEDAGASPEEEVLTPLFHGDRVAIRHLDDPRSRPESYVISEKTNDLLNGFLGITAPLARALSEASPGDELTYQIDGRERPVLYMNLERQPSQPSIS